jgi:hypothetical protein
MPAYPDVCFSIYPFSAVQVIHLQQQAHTLLCNYITAEQQQGFELAPIDACPEGLTPPHVLIAYLWSSVGGSGVLSDDLLSCHDCISAFIHTCKGGGAAKVA